MFTYVCFIVSPAKHGRQIWIKSPSASAAVAASAMSHLWFQIDNFRRDATISFFEGKHIKFEFGSHLSYGLFYVDFG